MVSEPARRWKTALAPLLKFLKTTGIGGREGTREREPEWERKKTTKKVKICLGKLRRGKPQKSHQVTTARQSKNGRNKPHRVGLNHVMQRHLRSVITQRVAYRRKTGREKRKKKKADTSIPTAHLRNARRIYEACFLCLWYTSRRWYYQSAWRSVFLKGLQRSFYWRRFILPSFPTGLGGYFYWQLIHFSVFLPSFPITVARWFFFLFFFFNNIQ